jgi:hypothetical protein
VSRTRVAKLAESIEIVHENTCLHKSWNFLFRLRQRKSKEQADSPRSPSVLWGRSSHEHVDSTA